MRIVILERIPEDPKLREEWNRLVLQREDAQVFYTYEWSVAVQRAYSGKFHPLIFLARDENDELCGLVSLALDAEKTSATFLCATTGDYCDFLANPHQKMSLVSFVLDYLRQRNVGAITLTNLPADSTTITAIKQSSSESGYRCFARTAYICTQVRLSEIERRKTDNTLVLPGRKMVRRSLAAMGSHAPVRLEHVCTSEAVTSLLPDFVKAHIARFSTMGRVSNLEHPDRRRFIEELSNLLTSSGWLVVTRMVTGDKVLAWNYGFRFHGTWFWYQPTFDTDAERFSPGFCLLSKLIEDAAQDPKLKVVDLGLGAEEYKDRFANDSRETLYVTLRQSLAKHIKEVLRYRVTELLRASPRLERWARHLVSHLGGSTKRTLR